jgi:hypothetical protein
MGRQGQRDNAAPISIGAARIDSTPRKHVSIAYLEELHPVRVIIPLIEPQLFEAYYTHTF